MALGVLIVIRYSTLRTEGQVYFIASLAISMGKKSGHKPSNTDAIKSIFTPTINC